MCSVFGRPSDGAILMDQDRPYDLVTIFFSQPVSAFGAYWGSGYGCSPFQDAATVLTFQDVNGNVIGSDSFLYQGGDGTLEWAGYAFATPVKTITRTASDGQEGFAVDGLQATVASGGGNSALLSNISTRAFVQTGDNVMIGGLIITGSGQKTVAVRAIGPSLPVQGALSDPVLELHNASGALIATNDNWRTSQQAAIIAAGLAPGDDRDSALIATLDTGNYTAIVRGANNATGVAIVEVYDLDPGTATARLGNISTRGNVLTVDNVMIGGFIITGTGQKNVIVRAIGPSLTQQGITNPLLDPTLELHDGSGAVIAFDDNWRDSQQTEIQATGLAPGDDRESVILRTLSPGNYTAIVRGKNNTIGVALVEVYGLN
jgi:hypothetical protein